MEKRKRTPTIFAYGFDAAGFIVVNDNHSFTLATIIICQ